MVLVGSSIVDCLKKMDMKILLKKDKSELNLLDQKVQGFFKNEKPDNVICAAAKVGGIYANQIYPWQFFI